MTGVGAKALRALILTPFLSAAFLTGILFAFSIPNAPIVKNLTDRPEILLARRADNGRVIDADTECIGMSVGLPLSAGDEDLLKRAVNAQSLYGCDPLMRYFDGSQTEEIRDYFRYWHGYLIFARPMLAMMPYNDVRGLIFTVSLSLLVWFAVRLGRDFGAPTAIAFAAPFLVTNAMGLMVVATKATTWCLAVGAALWLSRRKSAETPLLGFFVLGALVAYFDFFTAPAFIVCFAALVWVIYERRAGRQSSWGEAVSLGLFWGIGWAGFILIKIAISAAVLGGDVWSEFIQAALFRVRGESEYVDTFIPGMALYKNLAALKSFWAPVALISFIILPLATKERRERWRAMVQERSVLLGIAAAPLIWLEIFSNHAQIHAAFTQINYAPAFVLAGLIVAGSSAVGQSA